MVIGDGVAPRLHKVINKWEQALLLLLNDLDHGSEVAAFLAQLVHVAAKWLAADDYSEASMRMCVGFAEDTYICVSHSAHILQPEVVRMFGVDFRENDRTGTITLQHDVGNGQSEDSTTVEFELIECL